MKNYYVNNLRLSRLALLCIGFVLMSLAGVNGQSGTIFRDYNANGTKETNEPLVSGILVKAYNTSGVLCASATSSGTTAPNYTLPTTCTGQVRVEFEIPATGSCNLNPSIDYSSSAGATNGTSVQFVSNTGIANFAIADPSDYNSSTLNNPKLFTSCYVSGNNLGTGNVGAADALVSVNYNPTGNSAPAPAHYSNTKQIGSTWGLAYSKQAKRVFTSAVLKRHTGLGPLGSGGIYMIDPSKQLPDLTGTTNFLDFDAIGIPTRGSGTYAGQSVAGPVVAFSPVIGSNTDRGLGTNLNSGEADAQALAQSGRVSFGDLDVSDDGRYLYVMNLFDKKLYEIDLTDAQNPVAPTSANKATKIKSWAIPEPFSATKGTARPWSIGYYRGKVYIGIVCDGNVSQAKADLSLSVYELNTSTGVYTSIFTNTLDFPRGLSNGFVGNGSSRKGWFAWTDDWNKLKQGTGAITWPQPILSDIEFDSDGSLILGFIDRTGLQGGWNNKSPITGDNTLYLTIVAGDLLRAFKKADCQWELESAGKEGPSSSKPATGGATNGEGPGGGEFYYEEFFATQHRETAMGGLAILFGSGDVVSTIYDPFQYDSFGLGWFDNTTGKKDKGYEIFATGNSGQTPTSGTFSKGLTLGDLEIEAELPPIEIGNRVWLDTDKDGIQDAGEVGISGITVTLCLASAPTTAVSTATTDANGNYFFSSATGTSTSSAKYGVNIAFGTGYILKFPTTSGVNSISPNIGAGSNVLIDSDATSAGTIALTTGSAGQNNHSFDVAYSTCTTPTAVSITQSPTGTVAGGAAINLTANATGTDAATTYAWSGPSGFSSTIQSPSTTAPATAGTYTYSVTISNGGTCTATATSTLSVTVAVACTPITNLTASVSPTTVITGGAVNLSSAGTGLLAGTTTYSWSGPNGFTATTQNPSTTAPATAGSFVYSVSVQNSNGTGVCTATATTSLSVSTGCVPPTNVTASITPPTCAGATAQSNGILQLSGFTNEKYQYVTGNSFTGTATPASPTAIPSNSVLISTLANTAQTFTVRVYSATDNTCFIDRTVSLTPVVCNCPPPTCVPIGITVNN